MGRSGNLPGYALQRGDENTSNPRPECKPAGKRGVRRTTVGVRTPHKLPISDRSTSVADSSFDVVSKVDRQEVDNALNQAAKELNTRYDFRGTGAGIEWSGEEKIVIQAESEDRVKAALEVFKEKLIRRDISLKAFDAGDPQASGKVYKITGTLVQGISQDNAKKISKKIRDEGPKGVKAQIQGEELRVSSKSRDDLQAVISLLKNSDFEVALQFVNYR
ncbi:YajQ family cyclic di-GMP-binding protein [Nocardia otitidiscaviarum]|uniref:Nucleotide-binding protein FOH10_00285 n=1 Tax=Nocardia otitidiscaviarum TaxID=1823 RepID=A0A516NES3_9NOCA|nr:YajQ family cyclic di-GMP-binding protein [Nocardia otitidiscaviarum]